MGASSVLEDGGLAPHRDDAGHGACPRRLRGSDGAGAGSSSGLDTGNRILDFDFLR